MRHIWYEPNKKQPPFTHLQYGLQYGLHMVSHNILSAGPGPMRPRGHSNTKIENPEVIQSQTPKYPKIQKSSKNIPKSQSPKIKTKQKSQNPKIQNQYIIKSQNANIKNPKSQKSQIQNPT